MGETSCVKNCRKRIPEGDGRARTLRQEEFGVSTSARLACLSVLQAGEDGPTARAMMLRRTAQPH